jgi:type I restriction-modification system DNA methylase subunit
MTEIPPVVMELVERYARNRQSFESAAYLEAPLREEFINRLFEEGLGWDVSNRSGVADAYKDVSHEDSIRIGQAHKAPDYCFRIGGVRKFFLEAKKPRVCIKDDPTSAYQLRRYAWSSKLPLSILTNFAEFAVYDCRIRPKQTDKAAVARIMYLPYEDYAGSWEKISGVFSKESVLKGLFDQFAESSKPKKGTSEVDHEFLGEIERWREALAKNIASRNPGLTVEELNFSVQKTIDRIIFLRMCEDRGAEKYGQLKSLIETDGCYKKLQRLFVAADEKYNSGLFHFNDEKERLEPPDELTTKIAIDDNTLRDIFRTLYYPESPYEFSILHADILGSVYEQFLGKVIRLTAGHHAKVEEKPEVKKAGGVYYTPAYVVDYIVDKVVSELIRGRTPKQIEKIRILDPACGSGSFLVGAYAKLLDYHLEWYTNNVWKKHPNQIYQGRGGLLYLTTQEKKRILLNNIYGVDVDSQAVEVTKLNLLLKVLENESQDTLEWQQKLWRERALPDLAKNVKCGDSLIGTDFFKSFQMKLLEDQRLPKAFDWRTEFGGIMSAGGFDAVIGNPPWGADFTDRELEYLRKEHTRIIARMIDSYIYFVDQSEKLVKPGAPIGLILPGGLLNQVDVTPLRRLLLQRGIRNLIYLGQRVFGRKVLNTSVVIVSASQTEKDSITLDDFSSLSPEERGRQLSKADSTKWSVWKQIVSQDPHLTFFVNKAGHASLLDRLRTTHLPLRQVVLGEIQRGVSPDVKEMFVVSESVARSAHLERRLLKQSVSGVQIKRYGDWECDQLLLYIGRDTPIQDFPNAYRFLGNLKHLNTCREVKEGKHPWWALHRPRDPMIFESPKFIGLTTTKSIEMVYDQSSSAFVTDSMYVFRLKDGYDPLVFMAIVHSKLFLYLYRVANQGESRVIPQVKASKLDTLPIPRFDTSNPVILRLADECGNMLALNHRLVNARTPDLMTQLKRQIELTDRTIDQLVYELYGLTQDEVTLVEQSTHR